MVANGTDEFLTKPGMYISCQSSLRDSWEAGVVATRESAASLSPVFVGALRRTISCWRGGQEYYSVWRYFFPQKLVFERVLCFVDDVPPALSVYGFPKKSLRSREVDLTVPSGARVSRYSFPQKSVRSRVMPVVSPVALRCRRRSSPQKPTSSRDSLSNCPKLL